MRRRVLGIDPGKLGGLVVLEDDGGLVRCVYQRQTADLCSGREYLPELMDAQVSRAVGELGVSLAVLERCSTRPMEGRTSALTTGIGWGLWRGILAGRCPVETPTPQAWQRVVLADVAGEGKARSIARAVQVLDLDLKPGLCRTYQDGLADAACLAWYGLLTRAQARAA